MITYWTFDRWGRQTGTVQDVLEAVHSDELNGEDSLTLTTPTCDLSKGDRIVWRDKFGEWHEHIVNDIKDEHADGALLSVVYCENSLAELYTDHIDDIRPSGVTAAVAMGRVLDGTRWSVGIVTVTGTASTTVYHASAREGVSKVVEAWGGEVSTTITVSGTGVSGRAVNLGRRGHDHGKRFEWSKDIQSVTREVLTDDVCTALYGYGKGLEAYDEDGELTGGYERRLKFGEVNGGLDYVADEDAKLLYGLPDGSGGIKHTFGRVIFEDCEDMDELLALTRAELDVRKHPQVSYTATVVDLADAGLDFEDVRTGDTVALIDHGLGERLQGRVLRVQRHLLDEGETVVTLGNLSRSITDELSRQLGLLNDIMAHTSAWDSSSSNTAEYVAAVLRSLNKVMNQTGGYVYMEPGEGIVTYDRPEDDDPTMVVKITGGGIGIANSRTSGGDWDWKTLIVSGHVAAELVTAVQIVAGFIGNVDGTYWDLDSGVLNISGSDTLAGETVSSVLTGMEDETKARKATYGVCSTAADAQAKTVTCANFALYTGATVTVRFNNGNTHSSPTLNVNGTGTIAVKGNTGAALTEGEWSLSAGATIPFTYDGSHWRMADVGSSVPVAGHNLLVNCLTLDSWKRETNVACRWDDDRGMWAVDISDYSSSYYGIYQDLVLDPNTEYTLSVTGLTVDSPTMLCVGLYDSSSRGWPTTGAKAFGTTVERLSMTVATGATNVYCRVYLYVQYDANGGNVGYFVNPKLEVGRKATPWEQPVNASTYGYCDSMGSNRTYAVVCDGFELYDGAEVTVYFDIDHGGYYFNLNVNGSGSKPVMVAGAASSDTNNLVFCAGTVLGFSYSAGAWWLQDSPGSVSGECLTAHGTQTKVVTVDGGSFFYMKGTTLTMRGTEYSDYASGLLKLNVGNISSAAYGVYLDGAATSSSNKLTWDLLTTLTFSYDGAHWHFVSRSDASKTATNHLHFDTNTGLKIAASSPETATTYQQMTATSTGYYIAGVLRNLLNAAGMKLFDSSGNESAVFTDSLIELAKNSASAVIKMCAGRLSISHGTSSGWGTGESRIESEDNIRMRGHVTSTDGTQVGVGRIELGGSYLNMDGINAGVMIVADSDPENTCSDGRPHSASIHVDGGGAVSGASSSTSVGSSQSVSMFAARDEYYVIGDPDVESSSDTKSISNATDTTICSITLDPGVWLINSYLHFASNSSGRRGGGLTANSSDACDHAWAPANGAATSCDMLHHRTIDTQTTYYLRAYQSSGGSLSVSGSIIANRLT